jgi:hypothetical protein
MADADRVMVDQQLAIDGLDQPGKAAMRRVVAGQVGHAFQVGRLVDGDHLEIVRAGDSSRARRKQRPMRP